MSKSTKGLERKQGAAKEKRVAIIDHEKCKPKSTAFTYLAKHAGGCGKDCISVVRPPTGKAKIRMSDFACSACLLRASKCPGDAVRLAKIPTDVGKNASHHCTSLDPPLTSAPDFLKSTLT